MKFIKSAILGLALTMSASSAFACKSQILGLLNDAERLLGAAYARGSACHNVGMYGAEHASASQCSSIATIEGRMRNLGNRAGNLCTTCANSDAMEACATLATDEEKVKSLGINGVRQIIQQWSERRADIQNNTPRDSGDAGSTTAA